MTIHEIEELKREVVAELESLGTNGFEVASTLEALQVTGLPCHATCCPLAHHLDAVFESRSIKAKVGRDVVRLYRKYEQPCGSLLREPLGEVKLTPGCREFVVAMDDGNYPWLVKDPFFPHRVCVHL
jgi:hypothetical protein